MENKAEQTALLRSFWENTLAQKAPDSKAWNEQLSLIHRQGRGLEETLLFLYQVRPDFDAFKAWMNVGIQAENSDGPLADVLSPADLRFFAENGYVVLQNAVTAEQCISAQQAILNHLDADVADPSTWYSAHAEKRGMMLMFYHHPALAANRQSGRIKKAFEQLYQSAAIHLVIDKVSFNPPETDNFRFMGSPLHWDVSLFPPIPFKLQGLLYLNDVAVDGGAFYCVPGFHLRVEEWMQQLPSGVNPRDEAARTLQAMPVPGKAGDLIIWHQALPHCASANRSAQPRFVQYITYDPDHYEAQEKWI